MKRLCLTLWGIQVIKTEPMSEAEVERRSNSWREIYGKSANIEVC